jgi:hypothetical protein
MPSSIVQKLACGDSDAWRWLASALVPLAKKGIRHEFQLGTTDDLEVEAALYSAFTSFQGHFLQGELSDPQNLEELALHLIRIAHNRWQRARYHRNLGGQWPFDVADPSSGPEKEVIANEMRAYIHQVIHQIMQEEKIANNPRKLKVLRAYVADPSLSQEEIARRADVSQSAVSRWIGNFKERIKTMLRVGEGE